MFGFLEQKTILKTLATLVVGLPIAFCVTATRTDAQQSQVWVAGKYTFSDELGGFRITGVSGVGTRSNPIVIRQVIDTAYSATITIRLARPSQMLSDKTVGQNIRTVHFHIETVNNTNLPWVGLGFELQERLDKASDYLDGLSFDQVTRRRSDIYSNRFLDFEEQFEPGDRIVYTNGVVNNSASVETGFVITDFTPVSIFYLYQDPLIPAS